MTYGISTYKTLMVKRLVDVESSQLHSHKWPLAKPIWLSGGVLSKGQQNTHGQTTQSAQTAYKNETTDYIER